MPCPPSPSDPPLSCVPWCLAQHMIMSSSCDYLLREYLGVGVDGALERRLVAYLDLKLKLGMAEFLSPVCRYSRGEGKGYRAGYAHGRKDISC